MKKLIAASALLLFALPAYAQQPLSPTDFSLQTMQKLTESTAAVSAMGRFIKQQADQLQELQQKLDAANKELEKLRAEKKPAEPSGE